MVGAGIPESASNKQTSPALTGIGLWQHFEPDILKLEKKRQAALISILLVFSGTFLPIAVVYSHVIAQTTHMELYSIVLALALLPSLYTYRTVRRGMWLSYKPLSHNVVRRILGKNYRSHGIIETDELLEHGILPDHCRLYREEGYKVHRHGYRIQFQEIDAIRSFHPASVREWREVSVGSGLYVDIELKRDLPAHTVLMSNNLRTSLKYFIRRHASHYKPVGLVSPKFKNRFDVLSTDQIEARVAFHPAFIEKFMDIAALMHAQSIEASFLKNKLLIHARYKRDLFQLGYLLRPLKVSDLDYLIEELTLYDGIVEALRLNPYTSP